MEFCILKVLPTGFTSNSGCFLLQRAAQKLRRINNEISGLKIDDKRTHEMNATKLK